MGLLDWIVLPLLIFTHDDEFDYVVIPEVQGEASSDSGPQFFPSPSVTYPGSLLSPVPRFW